MLTVIRVGEFVIGVYTAMLIYVNKKLIAKEHGGIQAIYSLKIDATMFSKALVLGRCVAIDNYFLHLIFTIILLEII